MADALKKSAPLSAFGSDYNAQIFLIKSIISQSVSTAIPVRVDKVTRAAEEGGANYVSVTPLICQTDANGNVLPQVSIPKLPYFRLQHGTSAIILDPEVGDVGFAVFAQQDTSNLTGGNTPIAPGSFRSFDMSDGFYFGGFWGKVPTSFVKVENETITIKTPKTIAAISGGDITIDAATNISVTAGSSISVKAGATVTIDAPNTTITKNVSIGGTLSVSGSVTGDGGISLKGHTHGNVENGSGRTSGAQ